MRYLQFFFFFLLVTKIVLQLMSTIHLPDTGVTGCSCDKCGTCLQLARSLAAHCEARDGLLSICAALNLLLQQVFCRPVDVQTEPSGYRLITVNEIHNSGLRNPKTHTQQKDNRGEKRVLLILLNYSREQYMDSSEMKCI